MAAARSEVRSSVAKGYATLALARQTRRTVVIGNSSVSPALSLRPPVIRAGLFLPTHLNLASTESFLPLFSLSLAISPLIPLFLFPP